jgi:rRNA maturation protein Nop10
MITSEGKRSTTKYTIRAKCPQCGYGDVTFVGPESFQERFLGDNKAIDMLCPICGTKHEGKLDQEEKVE